MLLTQRYMLAHIPLTKINILASVLTFTSSFSSHLHHYTAVFIAHYLPQLPAMCIPLPVPLPASSPLSHPTATLSSPLSLAGSYLPMAAALISISLSTPAHQVSSIPLVSSLNCKLLRRGTNTFTFEAPHGDLHPVYLFRFHNKQRSHLERSCLELHAFITPDCCNNV